MIKALEKRAVHVKESAAELGVRPKTVGRALRQASAAASTGRRGIRLRPQAPSNEKRRNRPIAGIQTDLALVALLGERDLRDLDRLVGQGQHVRPLKRRATDRTLVEPGAHPHGADRVPPPISLGPQVLHPGESAPILEVVPHVENGPLDRTFLVRLPRPGWPGTRPIPIGEGKELRIEGHLRAAGIHHDQSRVEVHHGARGSSEGLQGLRMPSQKVHQLCAKGEDHSRHPAMAEIHRTGIHRSQLSECGRDRVMHPGPTHLANLSWPAHRVLECPDRSRTNLVQVMPKDRHLSQIALGALNLAHSHSRQAGVLRQQICDPNLERAQLGGLPCSPLHGWLHGSYGPGNRLGGQTQPLADASDLHPFHAMRRSNLGLLVHVEHPCGLREPLSCRFRRGPCLPSGVPYCSAAANTRRSTGSIRDLWDIPEHAWFWFRRLPRTLSFAGGPLT